MLKGTGAGAGHRSISTEVKNEGAHANALAPCNDGISGRRGPSGFARHDDVLRCRHPNSGWCGTGNAEHFVGTTARICRRHRPEREMVTAIQIYLQWRQACARDPPYCEIDCPFMQDANLPLLGEDRGQDLPGQFRSTFGRICGPLHMTFGWH